MQELSNLLLINNVHRKLSKSFNFSQYKGLSSDTQCLNRIFVLFKVWQSFYAICSIKAALSELMIFQRNFISTLNVILFVVASISWRFFMNEELLWQNERQLDLFSSEKKKGNNVNKSRLENRLNSVFSDRRKYYEKWRH